MTHRRDNKTAVVVHSAADNWLASLQKLVHKTLADFSRKATRGLLKILRYRTFSPDQARLGRALECMHSLASSIQAHSQVVSIAVASRCSDKQGGVVPGCHDWVL